MRVLIVEDYAPVRDSVAKGLTELGVEVSKAADGPEAQAALESSTFDVVILDLMLPGIDGLSILREMRGREDPTMVLVLTARDTVSDRVTGLDAGADDYLVKPFAFDELVARVRALYRRKHEIRSPRIQVGDLAVDLTRREARFDGELVVLSPREYNLLECLALRHGRVVTREEIWMEIYDLEEEPSSNVVDVYIGYLRKKLSAFGADSLIQTRRGLGYVLTEGPA
jgi:DNA-binding response OmpR family regulator